MMMQGSIKGAAHSVSACIYTVNPCLEVDHVLSKLQNFTSFQLKQLFLEHLLTENSLQRY